MKFVAKLVPVFLLTPMVAFGQSASFTSLSTYLGTVISFINGTLVPFLFAIGFLVFLWGMFKTFILGGSDEAKQQEGKQIMIYAIAGFVIMISFWGIVNLISAGLGLGETTPSQMPDLPSLQNTN